MTFDDLDLMARGGSLALLALWSLILWRDHRAMLAARLAILMNLCVACYLIVTAGWAEGRSIAGLMFALGAGATPGVFWLVARSWFGDRTELGGWPVALVALSITNNAVGQLTFGTDSPLQFPSSVLMRILMFGFAAAGLWEAWRDRAGDLVEGRPRLRLAVISGVGGYVVIIALAEMLVFDAGAPRMLLSAIASSIVFVTLSLCAMMLGSRQADLLGTPTRAAQAAVPSADDPLARRLLDHMQAELPHRDETLTIASLAAQLGLQEYQLRRLINGTLGHRNFASFLNGYRLTEVKAALADPAQRDVPILTIALDAGFGSLGPFNRAFREAEGMTPSEYRAQSV